MQTGHNNVTLHSSCGSGGGGGGGGGSVDLIVCFVRRNQDCPRILRNSPQHPNAAWLLLLLPPLFLFVVVFCY